MLFEALFSSMGKVQLQNIMPSLIPRESIRDYFLVNDVPALSGEGFTSNMILNFHAICG